jgi:hypothetical protein
MEYMDTKAASAGRDYVMRVVQTEQDKPVVSMSTNASSEES